MSSAVFRQIASGNQAQKKDRLFRAALSAFLTLPRPAQRDIAQLDALAVPLLSAVTVETRRFAAAALGDCATPPPRLLRLLCEAPVDVSAPLLVRSRALTNMDLVRIIANQGAEHARVIARRSNLPAPIARLTQALLSNRDAVATDCGPASTGSGTDIDTVRAKLRAMMLEMESANDRHACDASGESDFDDPAPVVRNGFLESALARRLNVSESLTHTVLTSRHYGSLLATLRALGIGDAEAVLLTAARFPGKFTDRSSIQRFLERYRALPANAPSAGLAAAPLRTFA